MTCAYKRELAKRDNERFDNQERTVVVYAHALALLIAEEQFHYDIETLNSLEHEMFLKASEGFKDYKDDDAGRYDSETVPFMEYGFKNRLEASGIEPDKIEKQYDLMNVAPPAVSKFSHSHRRIFASRQDAVRCREVVLKAYWYAFMLCLAEDYGVEGIPLQNFYTELRSRYYNLWQHYLYLSRESDRYLSNQVHSIIKECTDKGIKVTIDTGKEKSTSEDNIVDKSTNTDINTDTDTKEETKEGEENNG